ncbi:MAG: rod shape-determining protein MreD [Desulfobacterales bacterium]|nr:rod shape-determining protein MreD [Desulfobacterales bacterium]
MSVLVFLLIGVLLLVIQTSLLPVLPTWLGRPEFTFLLIVFIPSRLDLVRGAVVVFFIGLLTDIFSGIFLGLYPITYLLIFFTLKTLYRYMAINDSLYRAPVAAAAYLLGSGLMFVAATVFGPGGSPEWSWGPLLLQTLMIAILAMPCFTLFDYCWQRTTTRPKTRWSLFNKKQNHNRFRT